VHVIRENREAEQIHTELFAELLQILLNPDLPVVEILPGASVLSHEKTFADRAVAEMGGHHFIGFNGFTTSQTNHDSTAVG